MTISQAIFYLTVGYIVGALMAWAVVDRVYRSARARKLDEDRANLAVMARADSIVARAKAARGSG